MNLPKHIAAAGVAAAILAPVSPVTGLILFSGGSILIDLDHYLFYHLRTGKWDVRGMFHYFSEDVDKNLDKIPYLGVCALHTAEFFLIVAAFACYFPMLRYLLAGMIYHMIFDIIGMIRLRIPFIRAYSFIEHFIRRKAKGYPYC